MIMATRICIMSQVNLPLLSIPAEVIFSAITFEFVVINYMKSGCFFISGVSKLNMLETKKRPRKLLRRLIKIYVVCFVSQEVK